MVGQERLELSANGLRVCDSAGSVDAARRTIEDSSAMRPPESASGSEARDHEGSRQAPRQPDDDVAAVLVRAIEAATAAGRFDVVAVLAGELRERRLAGSGVVDLTAARARAKAGDR